MAKLSLSALLVGRLPSGYNFIMARVSANVRVNVLFFGRIRELTGLSEESADLVEGSTLADLFEVYQRRFPVLAGFRSSLVASRNQEFAAWETPLSAGDDIAFLPPVSGG